MVSRLLSSLSGMLSSSSKPAIQQDEPAKDDARNDNEQKSSNTAVNEKASQLLFESKLNNKKSDFDLKFMSAEALDRAIVSRLQSRTSTSVADALEMRDSASRIKLRCEQEVSKGSSRPSQSEGAEVEGNPASPDECPIEDQINNSVEQLGSRYEVTPSAPPKSHLQSQSQVNESLSQSSVMSHDMSAAHIFKHLPEDSPAPLQYLSAIKEQVGAVGAPGERRSIMYRNSRFNLENSSREALCSESSKLIPDELQSDALLHVPVFGIPDPSLHRRASLTSSTESIHGSVSRTSQQFMNNPVKKRTRSISPSSGRSYVTGRISTSQIGDNLFETSINDIVQKGGDEFKNKYSSWIWETFQTHLSKLKTLMISEFNEKMKATLEEKEHEVTEYQKRYRQKLVEFEGTTENFQKLMDNMHRENQRVVTAKDFIIDKLKKEFLECKKHFEQDLQRQLQSYRKEAEVDRIELQKRNDELMLIMLTDASKCGLEEAFRNEIESLHKMIKALTSQNEELHQQLNEATNSASILTRTAVENLESQLDHATVELMELRKKLQYAEREREDLTVSYNQEIAKLNRKFQESNTRYDHQLRDAAEELEISRKKHARDTRDMRQKMSSQESQYNSIINQVRQQYGSQVETLSHAVSQLRAELSGSTKLSH